MKYFKFIIPILIIVAIISVPWLFPYWVSDKQNWINAIAALGTLGALIFLIIDKIEKEKAEKEVFWHEHLPYLTVGSPCDPTQNRCDINLLENNDDIGDRGSVLFSIVNFSDANAYDVQFEISTSKAFSNDYTRKHFIDFVPVYAPPVHQFAAANGVSFFYSKFHIDPDSKEVRLDEFDICNFANNCEVNKGLKTLFIRLSYFSASELSIQKKVTSVFKVNLECENKDGVRSVIINNIIRIEYKSSVGHKKKGLMPFR